VRSHGVSDISQYGFSLSVGPVVDDIAQLNECQNDELSSLRTNRRELILYIQTLKRSFLEEIEWNKFDFVVLQYFRCVLGPDVLCPGYNLG